MILTIKKLNKHLYMVTDNFRAAITNSWEKDKQWNKCYGYFPFEI